MALPPTYASSVVSASGTSVTVTFNVSGTSPLLPASGVTGFVVGGNNTFHTVSAATSSGNTISLTVTPPIYAGQAVYLGYSPGNVTDSASSPNTLASFNTVPINNSTVVGLTVGSATLGTDGKTLTVAISGVTGSLSPASGVTGFTPSTAASPYTTTAAAASGSMVTLTLSGIIPAGTAVTLSASGGNLADSSGITLVDQTGVSVTNNSTVSATVYKAGAAPFSTNSTVDGSYVVQTVYGFPSVVYSQNNGDLAVRFRAAITDLWTMVYMGSSRLVLNQDGTQIAMVVPPGTNVFDTYHLATGLDGAAHDYEIVFCSNGGSYLSQVLLGGGTGLVSQTLTPKPIWAWYGDSIVFAAGLTAPIDSRQVDAYIATRPSGRVPLRFGYSGQYVSTYLRDHTSVVTSVSPAPQAVVLEGGVNDAINSVSASTFQSDYQTMIDNVRAGLPSAKIYCREIIPASGLTPSVRSTYNAAIVAAVTAHNAAHPGSNVGYFATDNWIITTPGVDTAEGLHPNASGYAKIGNREIPQFAAAGYSLSATNSGQAATATLTAATGATWTGDQTVTVAWGDGATSVVTPTVNGTMGTATHTYSTPGTYSVSGTNAQGWTDPAAQSMTATDPDTSSSSTSSHSSASSASSDSSSSPSSHSSASSASSGSSDSSSHSSPSSGSSNSSSSSSTHSSASSASSESSHSSLSGVVAGSSSSSSSEEERAAENPYPGTLDGDRYLIIATAYAEAYEGQVALVPPFEIALDSLKCLNDENVTIALLGPFYEAYRSAAARYIDISSYLDAVKSIQQHVSSSSGLDVADWIADAVPGGVVPAAWAALSKRAGWPIDSVIDTTTESSSSSTS